MTENSPDAPPEPGRLEHFAANVAHDFNNLLTGILGNLELMQNRAARTQVTSFDGYLESARNAGSRAAMFAQRLLAFSGRAAQDPEPTPIDALLHDIIEPMRERGVNIAYAPGCGPAQVLCDPAQAELALHELLDNAADAVAETGEIRIATGISGAYAEIRITDTGNGMSPQVLGRAFEPFSPPGRTARARASACPSPTASRGRPAACWKSPASPAKAPWHGCGCRLYLNRADKAGWDGRIRTSEWRNQNPLPYHLATSQCAPPHRSERPGS